MIFPQTRLKLEQNVVIFNITNELLAWNVRRSPRLNTGRDAWNLSALMPSGDVKSFSNNYFGINFIN
jgi:hypothetical protein